MLKDMLNEFINHQIQYPEFDPDTLVIQHYRLKPGFYFRLDENGSMDGFFLTKKTVLPENDPLLDWFKQADFASSLIEMNKPVDPKKQIHSNNYFTLFLKRDTFLQQGEFHPHLEEHINRYFAALLSAPAQKSADILRTANYETLPEEKVRQSKARFLAALPEIRERVRQKEEKRELKENDNCYIKLFLVAPLDVYAYESGRYLLPKIFNSNSYNLEVNGQVLGLSNANMGMNAKKPYLEHKTAAFQVPYRITAEEGVLLRKLFLWLDGQEREGKPLYAGYMPVGEHAPGLFNTAGEMQTRKPAVYVHFVRGMGLTIDDYDFLPNFRDQMERPVNFINYLDLAGYPGTLMNQRSAVEAHINTCLYGGQLVRNYDGDKLQVSDYLSQALAAQVILSRTAMHAWLRKGNELPLKTAVDRITMGVLLARLQNLEYVPALAQALNVRLALLHYFNEEDDDMGETIVRTYEQLKERVLNTQNRKEHVACRNGVEFYLAVGQLLYYYFSLSAAQKLHYDVLWRGVAAAKTAEEVKREHYKHFQKYAHAIDLDNPRFNHLLSVVTSYEPEKGEPVNLDALFYGFAASSIIYYKEKLS
jgi:CRISPR-associated protein Csh1